MGQNVFLRELDLDFLDEVSSSVGWDQWMMTL